MKVFQSSSSCPVLSSLSVTDKEKISNQRDKVPLFVETRQGDGNQGWVPGSAGRLNPFDDGGSQIDPLQEQLVIIKGFVLWFLHFSSKTKRKKTCNDQLRMCFWQ